MNTSTETMGERIRRSREELNLKQDDLAAAAGISSSAVSQIESGSSQSIKAENIFPIARLLKKNPQWLIEGKGPEIDFTRVVEAILALPDDSPQQSIDFIEYRWQRAEGLIASDKIAHYTAMLEDFRRDLDAKKGDKP